MMKRKILLIAGLFTVCAGLFAKGDTYIYDYWGKMEKSPDAYRVSPLANNPEHKVKRPAINNIFRFIIALVLKS